MLEAIRKLGVIVFICGAILVVSISAYQEHHPELLLKMQTIIERHKKISALCAFLWALLSLVGTILSVT